MHWITLRESLLCLNKLSSFMYIPRESIELLEIYYCITCLPFVYLIIRQDEHLICSILIFETVHFISVPNVFCECVYSVIFFQCIHAVWESIQKRTLSRGQIIDHKLVVLFVLRMLVHGICRNWKELQYSQYKCPIFNINYFLISLETKCCWSLNLRCNLFLSISEK